MADMFGTEMQVTEHFGESRDSFQGYRFSDPKGLAYGFLWCTRHHLGNYDTKMLLKVVFDKTAFVKSKISNREIYTSLWILKNLKKNIRESKVTFAKCL